MDVKEFKSQNPAYADVDDLKLADALFTKHYEGKIDRAEFETAFLGAPIKSDSILGAEAGDFAITRGAKSLARGAVDAFRGDAEFEDMGNINDAGITGEGIGNKAKLGAAGVFGGDDDIKAELERQYPDASFSKDKNGNDFVTLADGRSGYINKPGADLEDATRFLGKAASFVGAGASGALVKGGLAAKSAIVGGASAATDAIMQKLSGREEIDGGQVALTGALGAGSEALASVIGKLVSTVKDRFSKKQWDNMSDTARKRIVARQLVKDGFQPDDLRGLTKSQLDDFGLSRVESGDLVSPEASIAGSEFGLQLTRGQMMPAATPTQRANKFSQLSDEERLRSTDSGQRFRDIEIDNEAQVDENIRGITNNFGGDRADTALEGAERVHSGIVQAESAAKAQVDEAYAVARTYNAEIEDSAILAIPDRVETALKKSSATVDDDLTPGAVKMINDLKNKPVSTIEDLDIQRQRLNNMFSDTMDRRDRRALKIIKDEFDDAIGDAIDQQLFTGDPEALDALKNARALYADYAKKFRSNDQAGKVVQKMVDIDATPEEVSNLMVGVNGLSKAGASRIAKRYGEIVGRDSKEFHALREMAFLTVTRKPTGESKGAQALVSTLKKAMKGQGSSLMKELYTPAELATVKRFTVALESTLKKGDFAKSSGTAERMLRFYNSGGFRNLPFVDTFKGVLENHGVNKALLPPPSVIKPVSLAPVAGATSTSQ